LTRSLRSGLLALVKSRNIMVIGTAQTLFECSMYTFVLLYTPAIETITENEDNLPLGYLFSTMMVAVMVGSMTFQMFERQAKTGPRFCMHFTEDRLLTIALGLASCAFMLMAYNGNSSVSGTYFFCEHYILIKYYNRQRCYYWHIISLSLQLGYIILLSLL
jgi:hypothetical protein